MTPLQQFRERWRDGCGSEHCSRPHTRRVHVRGHIPCDLLFVGEAPGDGENCVGQPFVGEAGALLDQWIERAGLPPLRIAWVNLVACMPLDEEGRKAKEPDAEQILSCKERTEELIALCRPKLIIRVGKHSKEWLEEGFKDSVKTPNVPQYNIVHPAHVLRGSGMPEAQKSMLIKGAINTIRIAVTRTFGNA